MEWCKGIGLVALYTGLTAAEVDKAIQWGVGVLTMAWLLTKIYRTWFPKNKKQEDELE